MIIERTAYQKIKDFLFFPLRAITIHERDMWGLSSLARERFEYVAKEVTGYCLDVGCGRNNRLINEHLQGNGKGIDVYKYEGLNDDNIVEDITSFPFVDNEFDTVTFIGNINHIPASLRDIELKEAFRCLKSRGNVVITMGNPLTEFLVHKVVKWHDRIFGTKYDVDTERGMHKDETFFLLDSEIIKRLKRAGFADIKKKHFWTEWGLNHLFVAWKE